MSSEGTPPGQTRRSLSPGRELVLVSALYLLLTAALTYPLVLRLGSHIPGAWDAPRMVWDSWAFARAATDPQVPMSTTDLIFHPLPDVPTVWEGTPSLFLAVPFEFLLGPIITYNLIFLMSFVLSASFTFILARHLAASRTSSFVAGAIFSFSAYHYAHGLGHLHVFSMQWLPFCLLSLLLFWSRPRIGREVLLAIAMVLVVADSPYYALYFLAPVLVCFLVYQMWKDRSRLLERRFVAGLMLALGVAAISAIMVYPRMFFPDPGAAKAIAEVMADTERYSADLLAYVIPSPLHPVFGDLAAPIYAPFTAFPNHAEMIVFLGYVAILLAAWGLVRRQGSDLAFWGLLAVTGLTLSLGPFLHVNGVRVITLPYAALMRLPIFGTLRAPSRACVVPLLAVGVLASYGLDDLLQRIGNRASLKTVVGALVVLVVCVESIYELPYPTSATALPAFYRQLPAGDEQAAIFELPTGPGQESSSAWYMLYQTYHGKKLAHGYMARLSEAVLRFPHWVLGAELLSPPVELLDSDTWPAFEATFGDILAYNDIRYAIVQQEAGPYAGAYSDEQYREVRASLTRSLGEPFYEDDGLVAHEVSPQVKEVQASLGGQLELVGHRLVRTTSCPEESGDCTFLVTFWQVNAPVDERYGLFLRVTRQGRNRVLVGSSHRLGYQFKHGREVACYDTSWWAPGAVIADYALLPSNDSEGALLSGPLDIRIFVAGPKADTRLEARSDYYVIDDYGRLLIDSYNP
jgi:hypothetical protein